MKATMRVGISTLVAIVSMAAVALGQEGGSTPSYMGYDAIYLIWKTAAVLVLVWGVYDAFFRPVLVPGPAEGPEEPEWMMRLGKMIFYATCSASIYFFFWFAVLQCPC